MQVYDNIACESAPVADSHLANKAYVDAAVANGAGTASVSGDSVVSIPAHSLISCDIEPTEDAHLVNKAYVDAAVAAGASSVPIEEPRGLGKVVTLTELTDAALRNAITGATQYSQLVIKFAPNLSGTLTLTGGEITIYGHVIIEGENRITLSGGNASRLFVIQTKTVLTLRNLTITGGNGVGSALSQTDGGAIYHASNGVLNAYGCTFSGNSISGTAATCGGAAVYAGSSGTVVLTDCVFSNNSVVTTGATGRGGAIYGTGGVVRAKNCVFSGNSAEGATNSYGGAIDHPFLIADGCEFTSNSTPSGSSKRYGGAVYATGFTELTGCVFTLNSATSMAAGCIGGAVYDAAARYFRVDGCTFSENTAYYGSAVCLYGATNGSYDYTIIHSVFDNNTVHTSGRAAAVYVYYCDAVIEDCEFKNNSLGGASGLIYAYGYTGKLFVVTINRCKFTGNSSSATTTGLIYCANLAQVYLYNTVFTANSFTATSGNHKCIYTTGSNTWACIYNCTFTNNTNNGGAFYAAAGGVDIYNSVEYGNGSASGKGTNATVNAAKFLSDQSASVGRDIAYDSTKPLFAADGFTPVASSQVIDAGNNTYAVTEYDLVGKARVSGTAVDLGAVEYQSA